MVAHGADGPMAPTADVSEGYACRIGRAAVSADICIRHGHGQRHAWLVSLRMVNTVLAGCGSVSYCGEESEWVLHGEKKTTLYLRKAEEGAQMLVRVKRIDCNKWIGNTSGAAVCESDTHRVKHINL